MFIQLFRNQFLDNIRTVSTERFFVTIIVSYYSPAYTATDQKVQTKKDLFSKGP
ncbi:hypothetical protein P9126_11835 [Bacillus glycinifermentans]|uniref:hypothetical protein n=1 Tax=Bacillus glycinifermentans TaxID=1664069 RepID=UPI002DB91120|nr:hypothetical protein [Bacillus glycinifermentans]MEC3607678.1 hypothetical protein [Bacillus glycinifermentans]